MENEEHLEAISWQLCFRSVRLTCVWRTGGQTSPCLCSYSPLCNKVARLALRKQFTSVSWFSTLFLLTSFRESSNGFPLLDLGRLGDFSVWVVTSFVTLTVKCLVVRKYDLQENIRRSQWTAQSHFHGLPICVNAFIWRRPLRHAACSAFLASFGFGFEGILL